MRTRVVSYRIESIGVHPDKGGLQQERTQQKEHGGAVELPQVVRPAPLQQSLRRHYSHHHSHVNHGHPGVVPPKRGQYIPSRGDAHAREDPLAGQIADYAAHVGGHGGRIWMAAEVVAGRGNCTRTGRPGPTLAPWIRVFRDAGGWQFGRFVHAFRAGGLVESGQSDQALHFSGSEVEGPSKILQPLHRGQCCAGFPAGHRNVTVSLGVLTVYLRHPLQEIGLGQPALAVSQRKRFPVSTHQHAHLCCPGPSGVTLCYHDASCIGGLDWLLRQPHYYQGYL